MARYTTYVLWMAFTAGLASLLLAATVAVADDEEASPSATLFDTGSAASASLSGAQVQKRTGWTAVPEDNLTHRFQGDAVVMNDRLALVFRNKGRGVEVYSLTAAGAKCRTVLAPLRASDREPGSLAGLRIVENNPGAVVLADTFKAADGGTCSATFRLTAGQMIVEVRPGDGVDRLSVQNEAAYVVVPDFFGDDMVFPAKSLARSRLRLPAENFFLSLPDQGTAQVLCVWQSRQQEAVALRSAAGKPAAIAGYEIQAAKDKPIWVAILEGPGLWHEQTVSAAEAKASTTLDWKPPFSAKWRADLLAEAGPARSWFFHQPGDAEEEAAAAQSRPCCLESGKAVLRLSQDAAVTPPTWSYPTALLVYAMDRSQATPLTTFCPIDVLRNTLGVGPCQYILQTEGLAAETNPTPDYTMSWIEKQFKRKKEKSAAGEIGEMLDQMVSHVGHAQERIERYGRFGHDVRLLLSAQRQQQDAANLAAMERLAERLEKDVAAAAGKPGPQQRSGELAAQVKALIGKSAALAECQRLGTEVRRIGAIQDRTMANCRMAARWLKQSALMAAEDDPTQAPWAKKVAARAEGVLQAK